MLYKLSSLFRKCLKLQIIILAIAAIMAMLNTSFTAEQLQGLYIVGLILGGCVGLVAVAGIGCGVWWKIEQNGIKFK